MKKYLILLIYFGVNVALTASPISEVQTKLNAIKSMTAEFTEVVRAGSREVSKEEGQMALLRPGRFRWETKKPMEQLVIADGKTLWIYDVDLEQVTVKKQGKSLSGTPALFLSTASDSVSKNFNVIKLNTVGNETYELHAKSPKENYQRVNLQFSGEKLASIVFFDQLGQNTSVVFRDVQHNRPLKVSLFQFKAPKGVDVISQ